MPENCLEITVLCRLWLTDSLETISDFSAFQCRTDIDTVALPGSVDGWCQILTQSVSQLHALITPYTSSNYNRRSDTLARPGPAERRQFRPINAPRSVFRQIAVSDVFYGRRRRATPQRDVTGMTSHARDPGRAVGRAGDGWFPRTWQVSSRVLWWLRNSDDVSHVWSRQPPPPSPARLVGGHISDDWWRTFIALCLSLCVFNEQIMMTSAGCSLSPLSRDAQLVITRHV